MRIIQIKRSSEEYVSDVSIFQATMIHTHVNIRNNSIMRTILFKNRKTLKLKKYEAWKCAEMNSEW